MFLSPLPKLQRDVVVTGEYITPSWRALMRHVLAGRLIDRYSISEAFGGATSCETCGWWHFDPFVIPEVVTPVRRIPIEEGVGVLLITVLYPFQQAQPIVRYWTGDLVRTSISQTCHSGLFGFRPLGRLRNAVICSTCDTAVITPESLLCVFDQLPDIRRAPVLRDAHQVQPHWPLGEPIFRVAVSETQNDITAVVSFDAPSNTDVMRIDGQIRRLNPSLTEHSCAKEPTLIVTLA